MCSEKLTLAEMLGWKSFFVYLAEISTQQKTSDSMDHNLEHNGKTRKGKDETKDVEKSKCGSKMDTKHVDQNGNIEG